MTELLPVYPTHNGIFIDIIDRDVTQKDLGNGKVLHLIADDTFGPNAPHNPMTAKHQGVRPRWARVLELGPDVQDVRVGDLVLCDTLKWSRKMPLGRLGLTVVYFWRIAEDDILLVDDRAQDHETYIEGVRDQLSRMDINVGKI